MDDTKISAKIVVSSETDQSAKLVTGSDTNLPSKDTDVAPGAVAATGNSESSPAKNRTAWGAILTFYTVNIHMTLIMSILEITQHAGPSGWWEIIKLNLLQPFALVAGGGLVPFLQSAGHYQGYFIVLLLYAPLILLYPIIILFGPADGSIYTRLESRKDRIIEALLVSVGLILFVPPVFCQIIRELVDKSYAKRQITNQGIISFSTELEKASYQLQITLCSLYVLIACVKPLKFTYDTWFFNSIWLLPLTILLRAGWHYLQKRNGPRKIPAAITEQQAD
jgi:hypothetical protein